MNFSSSRNWSIQQAWNNTLETARDRETKPRDILYASDLGGELIDVYWKLKGVQPSNPFSNSAKRKMEAGYYYENLVVWVLQRCGMLQNTQGRVRLINDEKHLAVYGRYDILAGHDGNWSKTKDDLAKLFETYKAANLTFPFQEQVENLSKNLIEQLSQLYPGGLSSKIYEVKSINSMAFWRNDMPIAVPYEHHKRQLTFYQKYNTEGVTDASFLYIDRDTMSLSELPNYVEDDVMKDIQEWIDKITYYYRNNIEPPRPEFVIWDVKKKQWGFNWEIDRSPYRDKYLEGTNVDAIKKDIKERNKVLKSKEKVDKAMKNEEFVGIKKYKKSFELIDAGSSVQEVSVKMKIEPYILNYYIDKYGKKVMNS